MTRETAAITRAADPETHDDESDIETVCSHETPDAAEIELLPDALLITVLGFADDPARLALVLASKSVATRLKDARRAIVDGLNSTDLRAQLRATKHLRAMLSPVRVCGFANRPMRLVVDAGVVPRLVEFLQDDTDLQKEALWVLTNIALGSAQPGVADAVVEAGAVPIFCRFMGTADVRMVGQVTWALWQILNNSPTSRGLMLDHGAMEAVVRQLRESSTAVLRAKSDTQVVYGAVRLLSTLCEPEIELEKLRPAVSVLAKLLSFRDDNFQVHYFACLGLAHVSRLGSIERAQTIIDAGACPRLVELLGHPSLEVVSCALFAVGNICSTDDDNHVQTMIDLSVLARLYALLYHEDFGAQREAVWITGNCCAGNMEQIQAVLDFAGLVPRVVELLGGASLEVRAEASWLMVAISRGGSPEQVDALVQHGCIPALCELLKVDLGYLDDGAVIEEVRKRITQNILRALKALSYIIDRSERIHLGTDRVRRMHVAGGGADGARAWVAKLHEWHPNRDIVQAASFLLRQMLVHGGGV